MLQKVGAMDESGCFAAAWIAQVRRTLAAGVAARIRDRDPELVESAGEVGFADVVTDTETRLEFLCESLATARVGLFTDHLGWLKVCYATRGLPGDYVRLQTEAIRDELREALPPPHSGVAGGMLDEALRAYAALPADSPTLLADGAPHVELARRYLLAALEGRRRDAEQLVIDALEAGTPAAELETHVIMRVQQELGRMWQVGDVHAAEEHFASRLAERLLVRLLDARGRSPRRGLRVVVASVGGNDHDLAVRMLADRFDVDGWDPLLLGANMPASDIAQANEDFDAHLIALSTTMALHVRSAHRVCAEVRGTPRGATTPILIGGHPFRVVADLHRVVGADATAEDLDAAVRVARQLVGKQ
ncbi:MAG: cobalamin-dependent protein [Planctomycetes bacterium]|nr:cobalamin-dependent protein [Planctomycetota bacterium]